MEESCFALEDRFQNLVRQFELLTVVMPERTLIEMLRPRRDCYRPIAAGNLRTLAPASISYLS